MNSVLSRNLSALRIRQPEMASRLLGASPDPAVSIMPSRTGPPIPVISRGGHPYPVHSRFNPVEEGRRLAENTAGAFLIALGLGAAYHLEPLLEKPGLAGLVIVENSPSTLRSFLECRNIASILRDPRTHLLVNPQAGELASTLLGRYLMPVHGELGIIELRSRRNAEPQWFSRMTGEFNHLRRSISRDNRVQTRFGRRWFANTIANLARSEEVCAAIPPNPRLLIAAAGPSLEEQLPRIRKLQAGGASLLATDTSLPLLAAARIAPDIVLSIDCQVISYHHFFRALPGKTVLILDLASPPALARRSNRVLFIVGDHPFSLYLNHFYRSFPHLDLSGGNVTHAAASFAGENGALEVRFFGADFCYSCGRPYAAGTYLYPFFQSRSHRLGGSEDAFWKFIADSRPRREEMGSGYRLRTDLLDQYRSSLEQLIGRMAYTAVIEPGQALLPAPKTAGNSGCPSAGISAGPVSMGWRGFLEDYSRRVKAFPRLEGTVDEYLNSLEPRNRQAWMSLLPPAAAFRPDAGDGPAALEEARVWTLERVSRLLKSPL